MTSGFMLPFVNMFRTCLTMTSSYRFLMLHVATCSTTTASHSGPGQQAIWQNPTLHRVEETSCGRHTNLLTSPLHDCAYMGRAARLTAYILRIYLRCTPGCSFQHYEVHQSPRTLQVHCLKPQPRVGFTQ